MRLMIVDDERIVRTSLRYLLESVGIECDGFEDGRPAWEAFQAAPDRYDAIVTDLAMPDMRGTELAALIRERDASLPILILSGLLDDERVECFNHDGVVRMLAKPAQLCEILHALETQGLDVDAATAAA